jgi:hypothetical protein
VTRARRIGAALGLAAWIVVALAASRAQGGDEPAGGALVELWHQAMQALQKASDEREPPLVAPRPVTLRWQARRVSSIDLDAPLLALGAGDLDGDGRAELIALTTRELVIMERRGPRTLGLRARAPLPGEPAALRPRDPVGALVVADLDGEGRIGIAARSSERARGAVFEYREGALVEQGRFEGFPLCPGVFGELEPGRNYFAAIRAPAMDEPAMNDLANAFDLAGAFGKDMPEKFFAARCRDDLVDPIGRRLMVMSVLDTSGRLLLWTRRRCPRDDPECEKGAMVTRTQADKGVAFEIADLDRDGHPELVVTAKAPPGDPDGVTVLSWQGGRLKGLFNREFSGGVVGLTSGDIDGDGIVDLVAAVRLWGSNRVDLWTFH